MFLQPVWNAVLAHASLLSSPVFPVLFSLAAYLSCCLPFLLLDLLAPRCAQVRRWKLQPQSSASWSTAWSCLALTLYNHAVFIFPLTLLHWFLRPAHLPAQAPPLAHLLAQVLVCLLLFDFQSFTWHLLHHRVPTLYRSFHKVRRRRQEEEELERGRSCPPPLSPLYPAPLSSPPSFSLSFFCSSSSSFIYLFPPPLPLLVLLLYPSSSSSSSSSLNLCLLLMQTETMMLI